MPPNGSRTVSPAFDHNRMQRSTVSNWSGAIWAASLSKEMRLAFRKVTTYMRNWREPIFNYFDYQGQVTNAYTESLNSFMKNINRVGRGYSFRAIRAKILFNEYAARWSQNFERDDTGMVLGMHVGHYLGADLSTLNALLEKGEL